jgi:uncharacterized protein (DUF305 family)
MNSLVKNSALAIMLSLAMATTAKATQPDSSTTSVKPAESQSLIAQKYPRGLLNETRTKPYIDEMIMLHMQMVNAAERAMQSQNPEIRRMAEETMKSSNAQINTLMEMRRKFFENPDKG